MRSTALSALLCVLLSLAVRAQVSPEAGVAFSPMNVEFFTSPLTVATSIVIDAPYSAEAVTQMVQTLADGNRIVRESKALVSRDSRGRTRREQGFPFFGAGGRTGPKEIRHVQISDPEAGSTVMLDFENRIARKLVAPPMKLVGGGVNVAGGGIGAGGGGVSGVRVEMNHFVPAEGIQMFALRGTIGERPGRPNVEQLGQQRIEGVIADGTRTTTIIPAGEIGNERPIQIVSEEWYSADLKTLVMSRFSDPRSGETTYRLANLTLGEPPADQFEIPAGFQVMEGGSIERDIVVRRPPQ